jgi:cytochrome c nitrite reductase small subunit
MIDTGNLPLYRDLTQRQRGILSAGFGFALGIGLFIFWYASAYSYLGSNPKTCRNCHIMRPQYDSWQRSSHHAAATCVDCHLPHDFIGKYLAKSENGYHHSMGFTLQNFHEPIMIKKRNNEILQRNCVACHKDMIHDLVHGNFRESGPVNCVQCHRTVGHGETAGLGGPDKGETNERKIP